MTRVPPPWIIEEADPGRRRREEGQRPLLEIPPPPPPPARSGEDEPEARVIVIDLLLQDPAVTAVAVQFSRSRSDPRRLCSMETCGNRAKAAAFRARQRGGQTE